MASWDVKGKFAIVTGAGSGMSFSRVHAGCRQLILLYAIGINHAFAEQLLNAGCSVIFADIALRPEAEATISKFPHPAKDGKPSAVFHRMDQSDWSQIAATWDFALQTFGRVDLLCPGAGIWCVFRSL